MSVYVDDASHRFGYMVMCHMIADTLAELHAMAEKIGIQRRWFQQKRADMPHYDICRTKRKLAVKFGAIEIDQRETVRILIKRYRHAKHTETATEARSRRTKRTRST